MKAFRTGIGLWLLASATAGATERVDAIERIYSTIDAMEIRHTSGVRDDCWPDPEYSAVSIRNGFRRNGIEIMNQEKEGDFLFSVTGAGLYDGSLCWVIVTYSVKVLGTLFSHRGERTIAFVGNIPIEFQSSLVVAESQDIQTRIDERIGAIVETISDRVLSERPQ